MFVTSGMNLHLHPDLPDYALVEMFGWYLPARKAGRAYHLYPDSDGRHPVTFWQDVEQGWIFLSNMAALERAEAEE